MVVQENASFEIQVQCIITDDTLSLKNVSYLHIYTCIYYFPYGLFRSS